MILTKAEIETLASAKREWLSKVNEILGGAG